MDVRRYAASTVPDQSTDSQEVRDQVDVYKERAHHAKNPTLLAHCNQEPQVFTMVSRWRYKAENYVDKVYTLIPSQSRGGR